MPQCGESHLVLLLMHKPCSFSRATLRWCRWLKVGRGDAVGYKGLLEGDWFFSFLLHSPLQPVRGDQETWVLFAVLWLILSKLEQDPEPVSVPVSAEGTHSGTWDAKLPVMKSRGAAQSTLLSLTHYNSVPGFILFSQLTAGISLTRA